MLPHEPLYSLTATQILDLYQNDRITVEEYMRSLLSRLRERDKVVQAWAYLDKDLILSQARRLDTLPREKRGPLHGIAVGLKDIIHTKDMPTEFGSPLFKGARPTFDASLVSILRCAGAVMFGKTTTTEFVVPNSGPLTANPHDPHRTPGGSSAGSAAAVADMQVPLSFGSQTGGSVIRPAAYTGIFAIKPTIHLISPQGVKSVSYKLDTCGFFARSVADLQLIADIFAIREYDGPRAPTPLDQMHVAFLKTPMWSKAGPGTITTMQSAARALQKHGVTVDHIELPSHFGDAESLKRTHQLVISEEAAVTFLREHRAWKNEEKKPEDGRLQLSPEIADLVENKANFTLEEMLGAVDKYNAMRIEFDRLAEPYAAVITPSAVDVAPLGLHDMGSSTFNSLWTGLATPVIHVPAFTGEAGMPVGLSLVAGRYHDQDLLQVAAQLSEILMDEGGRKVVEPSTHNKI